MNAIRTRPLAASSTPLQRLSPNQQHLVAAMRKWKSDACSMGEVVQDLFAVFGIYYMEPGLEAFETLMEALCDPDLDQTTGMATCAPRLSSNELILLKLLCACQAGEWRRAQRFARDLGTSDQAMDLMNAASLIAEILDARGILFTLRDYKPLALMDVEGRS